MERDQEKLVHTSLGINNLIDHPVDIKERKLVTDTSQDQYVNINVCGKPVCLIEGHSISAARGTSRDKLAAEIPVPIRTNFELQHQLDDLKAQHKAELDTHNKRNQEVARDFRRLVAKTAMRYAKEHEWCGVVSEALQELGIEPTEGAKWVTVQFSVLVDVESIEARYKLDTVVGSSAGHLAVNRAEEDGEDMDSLLQLDFYGWGERVHDWTPVTVVEIKDKLPRGTG
jgi:hypothetical protein